MGFGILFVGYLFSFNTVNHPGFTKILSYLLLMLAMTKLSSYNKHLRSAFGVMIPTLVVGVLYLLAEISDMFSLLSGADMLLVFRLLAFATTILEGFFLFYLLRGLQALAKETEVPHLEVHSFRNRLFTVGYYILFLIGQLDFPVAARQFLFYYNLAVFLVGLVVLLLNAKLLFGFYMWICLPKDVKMERKRSSFRPLDKLYEKLDSMEENGLKRRREEKKNRKNEKGKDTRK